MDEDTRIAEEVLHALAGTKLRTYTDYYPQYSDGYWSNGEEIWKKISPQPRKKLERAIVVMEDFMRANPNSRCRVLKKVETYYVVVERG